MRIIKCDICKEELDFKSFETDFIRGRQLELCPNCSKEFKVVKNTIISKERELEKEFEAKLEKLYKSSLKNFNLKEF